ncbi:hypothetical protein Q7P36_006939 [Cladosporium allicinum]
MADQEPPRPPPLTGRCAPPPVKTKLSRTAIRLMEAMDDLAFMEEMRKYNEEFQREHAEQKLLEAAEQEKASGPARTGARDHEKAGENGEETTIRKGEETIIKQEEEDVDHGRINSTEARGLSIESGSAFDADVGILRCGDCRLDKTVSSHQAGYCYSSMTEYYEHHRSGYHSRKARVMRSFHIAKGRVVRNKAKCCGGWWTAEEFVGHLAEKHPDL